MTAKEVVRLAVYVDVRYGVGVCGTPVEVNKAEDHYMLDIHLRGNPHHAYCKTFSRGECEKVIDGLWLLVFPDIL